MPKASHLKDRAALAVSGPQAREFLQGLVTNDIEAVKSGAPAYAALLTPQGKILFDFLVHDLDGALVLDVAAFQREALQKRLTLYKLRAKVDIAARNDLAIVASWGDTVVASDPRHSGLGARVAAPVHEASGDDDYLGHRLALGIPEGADFGHDKMFALDADLDELHGVAFEKGCYVGQELTARMKHRGTARKRLLPVETTDGTSLPPPNTIISAAGREIGQIGSTYGPKGFAQVRLDRLDEVGNASIEAHGVAVRIDRPSWLFPS